MTSKRELNVARDFSKFPAGRYRSDGPYSGQLFRDKLDSALKHGVPVSVELDGTLGYGSSFLEEAFGGLVRECGYTADDLKKRLTLVSTDASLIDEVWEYIESATPERPDESDVKLRS